MADNKSKRGKADRDRINVHEDYEREYWKRSLAYPASNWRPPFARSGQWLRGSKPI